MHWNLADCIESLEWMVENKESDPTELLEIIEYLKQLQQQLQMIDFK